MNMHDIRDKLSMKGYRRNEALGLTFGLIAGIFAVVFLFCYFFWPVIVIGYFLMTWAGGVGFALAAWAAFKFFLCIILTILVSFIGMVVTPLVYEAVN